MDQPPLISRFFIGNWQRKIVAIISAIILWFFVSNSITETKILPNIPIRIVNLPADKTIEGLLPNRLLSKRVTLTLSGTKNVIQELEPGDLEVLLDVSQANSDNWIVTIGKKNLISLNPSIDLTHHVTQVDHAEFVLKISPLVTAKIPVRILKPSGDAPTGYEFLDIWPEKLMQTVSGPAEEIEVLKNKGLDLTFNLSEVTKTDLEVAKGLKPLGGNEVSFVIPDKWKTLSIPSLNLVAEELNDPEAKLLKIDFLKKEYLLLEKDIPITVFYPLNVSELLNPQVAPLLQNEWIVSKNDILRIRKHFYLKDVSRLFLQVVSENLNVVLVAAPRSERKTLQWSLQVVNRHQLEDQYVSLMHANEQGNYFKRKDEVLRKRFREYVQRLRLYTMPDHKLRLEGTLKPNGIEVSLN